MRSSGIPLTDWTIDGPCQHHGNDLHVYARLGHRMIGMIDCELRDNNVSVNMIYVSPPWRGTCLLRDMMKVLKHHYGRVLLIRSQRA